MNSIVRYILQPMQWQFGVFYKAQNCKIGHTLCSCSCSFTWALFSLKLRHFHWIVCFSSFLSTMYNVHCARINAHITSFFMFQLLIVSESLASFPLMLRTHALFFKVRGRDGGGRRKKRTRADNRANECLCDVRFIESNSPL